MSRLWVACQSSLTVELEGLKFYLCNFLVFGHSLKAIKWGDSGGFLLSYFVNFSNIVNIDFELLFILLGRDERPLYHNYLI